MVTPDLSGLADYEVDTAYAVCYDQHYAEGITMYGGEISRRLASPFSFLGGLLVPYMDQFPKYSARTKFAQGTAAYTSVGDAVAALPASAASAAGSVIDTAKTFGTTALILGGAALALLVYLKT